VENDDYEVNAENEFVFRVNGLSFGDIRKSLWIGCTDDCKEFIEMVRHGKFLG